MLKLAKRVIGLGDLAESLIPTAGTIEKPVATSLLIKPQSGTAGCDSQPENRRASPRIPMQIAVSLTIGNQCQISGVLKDISQGGTAVQMPVPLESKSGVVIRFRLPGGESEFVALGRVVWTDGKGGAGIQFIEFPQLSQKEVLARWLQHLREFPHLSSRQDDRVKAWHDDWLPVDAINEWVLAHDRDFRILNANRSFLTRLRRPKEGVVGKRLDIVLPGSPNLWRDCPYCFREASGEFPDPCFGGLSLVTSFPYMHSGSEFGGTVHLIKDMSDQHAVNNDRKVLDYAHEGAFVATLNGRFLDCNEAFARMLGYDSTSELMSVNLDALYVDSGQRERLKQEIERDNCIRNFEIAMRRKDGSHALLSQTSFATRHSSGELISYQGFMLDVTPQKMAEQDAERRRRELHLLNTISQIAENSFDVAQIASQTLRLIADLLSVDIGAVYLYDDTRGILVREAELGYQSSTPPSQLSLSPQLLASLRNQQIRILNPNHNSGIPHTAAEVLVANGAKDWRWGVLWNKERLLGVLEIATRSESGLVQQYDSMLDSLCRHLAAAIANSHLYHEISQAYDNLRVIQQQLLQSEKMASVGQLTAGVAHELNNPLTAVIGYTDLITTQDLDPQVRGFVDKLRVQATRMQKIVQNLLSFSRQNKPEKRPTSLLRVLENTLALVEYELKVRNIHVDTEIEFPFPLAMADPTQIEQVFLNILNNAADAICTKAKSGRIEIKVSADEYHLKFTFRDTGPGITDVKHVFDPFYTTKPVGKGTGLGLSICYGLIQDHGGEIVAANAPEGGAILTVNLPAVWGTTITAAERIRTTMAVRWFNGERVLVVEPNHINQVLIEETFRRAGLNVVTATRFDEIVELLGKESFEAILLEATSTDKSDGIDVYRWIEQNRPELLPLVIMTFAAFEDGKSRRFVHDTGSVALVKPFEMLALLKRFQALLGGSIKLALSSPIPDSSPSMTPDSSPIAPLAIPSIPSVRHLALKPT